MLKALALCVVCALASAGATLQAISSTVTVADKCRLYGYAVCHVANGAEWPTTSDPKLRAELTRFIRQLSRDRL